MTKSSKTKHKAIKLTPGFYAIRYLCDGDFAPVAILSCLPNHKEGQVEAIGCKARSDVLLSMEHPMALFRVAVADATVNISILLHDDNDTGGVVFDVERIPEKTPKKAAPSSSLVYLSGHVEWKGDVKSYPGSFLGVQSGTSRIEGFSVNWLKKIDNIDIRYGCTFGKQQETSTALGGGFVGSRGQSAPITSLWMALEGAAADQYDLQFTAVFAKAGAVPGRQEKPVSGTDGDDYLVGLCVSVDDAGSDNPILPPATVRKIKELKTFRA